MRHSDRVVLITGASTGIGYHTAQHLHKLGYTVYGTSRNPERLTAAGGRTYPFHMIQMDVDDGESVASGVAAILGEESRLDTVVNSAGYGLAGALEDTAIDEAMQQFETNFFGVLRVCRTVLPIMRDQGNGYLVNVGSIGGVVGIPFQSIYSASKFALEGLSEALRMEVEPYGIRVVLIQPGNYHTEFTASRITARESNHSSVYHDTFKRALTVMENDELSAPKPKAVARVIERAITADSPRLRYVVDPTVARFAPMAKRILPYAVMEAALKRIFKLTQ
jgi:short-subunit dehydrogenase